MSDRLRAFHLGLKESNYVEGKNVTVQYRFGPTDRLPELAAELVHQHVALIATTVGPATFAARTATTTIPEVDLSGGLFRFYAACACAAVRRRVNRNTAPDSLGATQMRPPWRSTIFLQIVRPMPLPGYLSRPCRRWNSTNTCWA